MCRLSLKSEAGANLVGGLVKLLCIERSANTKGDAFAEQDVVSNSSNTTVVDLGFDKRQGVQAILRGDFETDSVTGLAVPGGLGGGLDLAVHLVVVASSENAQVVAGGDGSRVGRSLVADSSTVAGDSSLVDVVAGTGTGQKAIVANHSVNIGSGTLQQVEESTAVEGALLEVQVELGSASLGGGQERENTLSFKALGQRI